MRRYTININGTEHVIDVTESAADQFQVSIDGTDVQVQLTDHQDLAQAEITPAMHASSHAPSRLHQGVDKAGAPIPAASTVSKPKPPAVPAGPRPMGASADGGDSMTAPMPGVVLSIEAQAGQTVSRGDLILVLEAMKMKNEIRATRDGQITEIPVSQGAQVKFGDILVRFA